MNKKERIDALEYRKIMRRRIMNEAKFTKGPWNRNIWTNGRRSIIKYTDASMTYAREVAEIWPTHNEDEFLANQNLVAAAPEMYEALSSYFKQAQLNGSQIAGEQLYPLARAVLEKARGES